MRSTMSVKSQALLLIIVTIFLVLPACSLPSVQVGLDKATRDALENSINLINKQPGMWQDALNSAITTLGNVGTKTAKAVLKEAEGVYNRALGETTAAVFCSADFIGIRVGQRLQEIYHNFDSSQPLPAKVPIFCTFDPPLVEINGSDTNTQTLIYQGFDFLDFNKDLYRLDIEYKDHELIRKNVGSVAVGTNYRLVVNISQETYQDLDWTRYPQYVLRWNDIDLIGSSKNTNGNPQTGSVITIVNNNSSNLVIVGIVPGIVNAILWDKLPPINLPPGLVVGLRHNVHQPNDLVYTQAADLSPLGLPNLQYYFGGDLGMSSGEGYSFWVVPDQPGTSYQQWKIPAGVVLGLKHSSNLAGAPISAFGYDATAGSTFSAPGMVRVNGGDLNGSEGEGYYWWETTGDGFDWQKDAYYANSLPRGTIIGLKHSQNNAGREITWNGKTYDATSEGPAPDGFIRMCGGDDGASSGQGFCWYEKVTGATVVLRNDTHAGELGFNLEMNTDRQGNDVADFPLKINNPQVCQAFCYANSSCEAWTFSHAANGAPHCWLKNPAPNPTPNNNCISGVTNH